ncbi:MAG TPA: DEAD/DEAH box helicase [Tepidisphaeraceae bacterium]
MSLAQKYKSEFSSGVKDRGREYFLDGQVKIDQINERTIRAKVNGSDSRPYEVEISLYPNGGWRGECSCPFQQDRLEPCKHLWATLLAADVQQVVRPTESRGGWRPASEVRKQTAEPEMPEWKRRLLRIRDTMVNHQLHESHKDETWPPDRRIIYIIDVPETIGSHRGVVIELATERLKSGRWQALKRFGFDLHQWMSVPDETDRLIAQMLVGAQDFNEYTYASSGVRKFILPQSAYDTTLKLMVQTGRCRIRAERDDIDSPAATWDEGRPWEFHLGLRAREGSSRFELQGWLQREDRRLLLHKPALLLESNLLIEQNNIAKLNHFGAWELLAAMRQDRWLAPIGDAKELLKAVYALPSIPPIEIPPEAGIEEVVTKPKPRLMFHQAPKNAATETLQAELSFDYAGKILHPELVDPAMFDEAAGKVVRRDVVAESEAWSHLVKLGFKHHYDPQAKKAGFSLPQRQLGPAVLQLTADGWHVEAEGKLYRTPGTIKVAVSSGIDWFDLTAQVSFGEISVGLPALLEALQKGHKTVVLDDGTIGLLPEEWLRKYGALASMGEEEEGAIRFKKSQAGLLDALLASMPEATCDATFSAARKELQSFEGIEPIEAPAGFVGELRPYQKQGLGWLNFLQKFGFGGCLADDMGLGKTIQVLSMLEARKQQQQGPSLVIVPRSLVFNWKNEAQKFTPNLRVLDQSGADRTRGVDHLADYDLVLTTYGTLRRDAGYFRDFTFDYVILDEAQAIKNPASESAKAARILHGNHRLAMSGTPIENHLGELWSLFEFLNPGMLGKAGAFRHLGYNKTEAEVEGRKVIAQAVRPFILRRTKQQVAGDLPEKMEQTILCELDTEQRKLYDELKVHYRQSLLGEIDRVGINKSKIQILEALLRLRQVACHPGLVDETRVDSPSAKLEALQAHLEEVVEGGNKALVFSQFTSFLALVRKQLDEKKVPYEYLDGQTRDRQARVEHFQKDPSCKLFLISLRAGGLGLNLTEANYVFLLDPWWNPAVEAQAIDRAHRIGQQQRVFAYRLIAKDTVEEKVLELQQSKRELADAIINADNSLIAGLGREDLERLLA